MLDTKQTNALGKGLIMVRDEEVDRWRLEQSQSRLRAGKSVAWVGHSGIGKSSESSYLMLTFLQNLGIIGWPSRVTHRIQSSLFEYSLGGENVVCRRSDYPGVTLHDVRCYCRDVRANKSTSTVLFLELDEDECDPKVEGLPTFIAVSSREVDTTLKSLWKAGKLVKFLVAPHAPGAVQFLVKLLAQEDRSALTDCLGLPPQSNDENIATVVAKRIDEVGPLLREILLEPPAYEEYIEDMHKRAKIVYNDFSELSMQKIPRSAQVFLAPYPLRFPKYQFRFLSNFAAGLVAGATTNAAHLEHLAAEGLPH